eukprot:TRINITY_DN9880_c0_g1_i5.p1 TRINITY_DN9880_c0_g1~~TRINITY_DN9880_c0_g1_i5.p1  ORF type:complete len:262 (+),score=49.07 TRINITY_DN9880_c0_g1_i5:183-968(+)
MDFDASSQSWEELNNQTLGITYVRGFEVEDVLDENKDVIGRRDKDGHAHIGKGNIRTFRGYLDTAQYQADMAKHLEKDAEDCYGTFNLLMRRKPKENNFKAVLATIRDLMQSESFCVPTWLHDVFLGYGDPHMAQYYSLPKDQPPSVRFADTFLDKEHLLCSFDGKIIIDESGEEKLSRRQLTRLNQLKETGPFEITFPLGQRPNIKALAELLYKDSKSVVEQQLKHQREYQAQRALTLTAKIGRAVQQECRDRSRMPSSA